MSSIHKSITSYNETIPIKISILEKLLLSSKNKDYSNRNNYAESESNIPQIIEKFSNILINFL